MLQTYSGVETQLCALSKLASSYSEHWWPCRGSPPGDGLGETPISGDWKMAMVDNQCPECAYGSIDLALTGDGRWKIEWYPVEVLHASQHPDLTRRPSSVPLITTQHCLDPRCD